MTKWVVAYRTSFTDTWDNWTFYFGCDVLQECIDASESGATFWEGRQFSVFRNQAPRGWRGTKRHYTHGLRDGALYIKTYGHPPPFPRAVGAYSNNMDSSFQPRFKDE